MGNLYTTEVQWGGERAPWQPNGMFVLGGRDAQRPVALRASSTDDGQTLAGELQYGRSSPWPGGEGKVGFRATSLGGSVYRTEVKWGGPAAPWHPNGDFVLGCREAQRPVSIQISSPDNGETLSGTMVYGTSAAWPAGEGRIALKARRIADAAIYRLVDRRSGDHRFTVSRVEADQLAADGWTDEGVAFTLHGAGGPGRRVLYRLFHRTGAGQMVTSDPAELRALTGQGWTPEGTLGYVTAAGVELHRIVHKPRGKIVDVVVTTRAHERDTLKARPGWEVLPSPGRALP